MKSKVLVFLEMVSRELHLISFGSRKVDSIVWTTLSDLIILKYQRVEKYFGKPTFLPRVLWREFLKRWCR